MSITQCAAYVPNMERPSLEQFAGWTGMALNPCHHRHLAHPDEREPHHIQSPTGSSKLNLDARIPRIGGYPGPQSQPEQRQGWLGIDRRAGRIDVGMG